MAVNIIVSELAFEWVAIVAIVRELSLYIGVQLNSQQTTSLAILSFFVPGDRYCFIEP